jgi:glutamate racemase
VLPDHEKRKSEQDREQIFNIEDQGRDRRADRRGNSGKRRKPEQCKHRQPDRRKDEGTGKPEHEQDSEQGCDSLAAPEHQPDRVEMADQGACRCRLVAAGRSLKEVLGDPDRNGAFQHIKEEGNRGQSLAAGAQHVGRSDIAGAGLANVALAGEPHQHQPERNRPQQIAAHKRQDHNGRHIFPLARSCGVTVAAAFGVSQMGFAMNAPMNPDAPLLFFDSGVGGLSVLEPVRKLLPTASIIYAADSAGYPYGTRSEAEIARHVPALLGRLVERFAPRLIVIACNTACTIALDEVRAALDIPVVGTVPAIKPAAETTRTGVIGVLGTQATIRQPYVDDLAARFASHCTLVRHGSAGLVDLAEAKLAGDAVSVEDVRLAAAPLFAQPGAEKMDTVVLACTHFPLLGRELDQAFPGIHWVDGGEGIARRVEHLTRDQPWPARYPGGIAVFTGGAPRQTLLAALARYGLTEARSL